MSKTIEEILREANRDNEPVLIIRARDEAAMATLLNYRRNCEREKYSKGYISNLSKLIRSFVMWRAGNKSKLTTD